MINIFGIYNYISQTGSVSALVGQRGGIILIWLACWKVCCHRAMILEFSCTQCAMCPVIETTVQIMKHLLQFTREFENKLRS